MKILVLADGVPPRVLGGSGEIAKATASGLAARGHDVTLVTAGEATPPPGTSLRIIPRLPTRWAHYRGVFSAARARQIADIIDDIRPDIIHAHAIAFQIGYRWIPFAAARGIPIVVTAHDVMHTAYGRVTGRETPAELFMKDLRRARWTLNPVRNAVIRRYLNTNCRVLCVSDALKDYMTLRGFRNLTTLHNGIDTAFWADAPSQNDARKTLGLPQDRCIFLLAGRLGFDKGTDLIVRTLPEQTSLVLAGDADMSSFSPLKDRVTFFPRQTREQMRLLYAACDAALVPSLCLDCFPTICLEAQAAGRPVLATSWGGAKEIVRDGTTGWILDPLDGNAWRARMQQCTTDRAGLAAMGMAGQTRIRSDFTLGRYLDTLEGIYGEERQNRKK